MEHINGFLMKKAECLEMSFQNDLHSFNEYLEPMILKRDKLEIM
jgi:hypothetical protein